MERLWFFFPGFNPLLMRLLKSCPLSGKSGINMLPVRIPAKDGKNLLPVQIPAKDGKELEAAVVEADIRVVPEVHVRVHSS